MMDHLHPQRPLPLPIRPGPRQKRWLYAGLLLLWLTGTTWLVFHYFLQVPGTFGPRPHPLEYWWLRGHGLVALFALLAVGTLFHAHIPRAWQLRRHRLTGGLLLAFLAILMLSGYALYYFSSDANAAWLPLLHWIPGLALPLAVAGHVWQSRRKRLRAARPDASRWAVGRR